MADLAVNIARRAEYLASIPKHDLPPNLEEMARKTQDMVKRSLDAFVDANVAIAREVCRADTDVDQHNRDMHVLIQDQIRATPEDVERLIHTLSVSRHLERIADLATNIAEDVIYTVGGEIVRHRVAAFVD
jgi:phosphate transport system protein